MGLLYLYLLHIHVQYLSVVDFEDLRFRRHLPYLRRIFICVSYVALNCRATVVDG